MWMSVTWFCGAYVFVGIAVVGLATTTGNGLLIGLSLMAYVLNIILLQYSKKKPW